MGIISLFINQQTSLGGPSCGNGWTFHALNCTGTQIVGLSVTPSLGSIMIDPGSRVPRF